MKRILIFYSHFAPAFKAGGPVQSLTNLVSLLQNHYQFFVVCEAFDVGENVLLEDIKPDSWNDYNTNVKVYYIRQNRIDSIRKVFFEIDADVIYINGMFLPIYNWFPLWLGIKQKRKIVMAPRGMLQQGALSIKPLKKKIFLWLFKLMKIADHISWHATDHQEMKDIINLFGEKSKVVIAVNVPKVPSPDAIYRVKEKGDLKLVYLSLVTEKKNLHLILRALQQVRIPICFDIYGPVNDSEYWQLCQQLMVDQIHTIRYVGVVRPDQVQHVLAQYHGFILPTKGENFGHAIYEALSVGTPAIISVFTPWGKLQDAHAGITIASIQEKDCIDAIETFLLLDQTEFDELSNGAYHLGRSYYYNNDFKNSYQKIF